MRFRAVLFDWDGTLLDSAEACYQVYAHMFADEGIPFDRSAFARSYSPNWLVTYEALGLPRERWHHADRRYLELWANLAVPMREGALALVRDLQAAGAALGLVTSGDRSRVEVEIERHGLVGALAAVVCGDDTKQKKPHPEGLMKALDSVGISPAEAAYVGDSPEDIHMARAAGVFSVGTFGGFPNEAALRAAAPDALAEDMDDMRRLLGLET